MTFKTGEIVWAKFDDFPYWPARICSPDLTQQLIAYKGYEGVGILFFGKELTYALIKESKIKPFDEFYEKYVGGSTDADFKKAIEMAKSNEDFIEPSLVIKPKKSERERKKSKKNPKPLENNEDYIKSEKTKADILVSEKQETEKNEGANNSVEVVGVIKDGETHDDGVKAEETKTDVTKVDETNAEEIKVEETKLEEAKVDKIVVEETNPEEVKVEDAKAEDAKLEEIKPEEAKVEDATPEEAKIDETKAKDAKIDGTKVEEAKIDETKPEVTKVEETKVEEVKVEENKLENAKVDETKPEDVINVSEVKIEESIIVEFKNDENKTNEILQPEKPAGVGCIDSKVEIEKTNNKVEESI